LIQKYQGDTLDEDEAEDDSNANWEEDLPMVAEPSNVYPIKTKAPPKTEPLLELNTDQDILVLVDEAHRGHTNIAHAT
jgi:type I site-specific restriction-modification system R (restriction) subunit